MDISMEAVISGDEGVEVEQPLLCWANSVKANEEVRNILKILLRAYRLTNDCYDKRFEGAKREEKLTKYLKVVDDSSPLCNERNDVERMKGVVKANILLRRGQVKADSFIDPTDDYQKACIILEQLYEQREPEKADFLEFLIQLNLGKYFRNMGMYMHRSDYYWRAHDEFENIMDKLVKIQNDNSSSISEINHEIQSWRSFIWLEAAMNLSRSELYLYDLKYAKIHLWNIYQKTACEIIKADSGIKDIFLGYEKDDGMSQLFPPQILAPILGIDERDSICKVNSKIRQGYAVQALLQLGIAFRKTRDYAIAREIFATIILQDLGKTDINVDALNNYVVCLRKCGFSIKDPTDVEKSFIRKIQQAQSSVIFDWNTKHIKQLYLAILSCIMQGKNTDFAIKEIYCSNSGKIKISRKNRFATMEYISFLLKEMNVSPDKIGNIGKLIDELLEKNPNDRGLFLQKGLFLQRAGKLEDSNEIFRKLYYDYPQNARGTIGLKAFYNVGCNLLAEKKYHEAKKYFEIKKDISSGKNLSVSNFPNRKVVYLNDLPNIDVLSEMDYAWCLMNIGEYEKAKKIYLGILSQYSCNMGRLGLHNEMKIRNNLIECCLQILAGYYQVCDESEIIEIINNNLRAIYQREPLNGTTLRHEGYFKLLLGMHAEAKDQKSKHYCNALKRFEKASEQLYNDVYVHSGWVSAVYELYRIEKQKCEAIDLATKRLHYISGPYAIRSCAKLSEILYSFIPDNGPITEEYKVLLRCMARIHISEGEEGYTLFQNLKENDVFFALDPVDRGRLLIILFQIYKNILDIKELCRYYPDPNNLPVQYRSIKRLKSYLGGGTDKPGRFTLMNVAYMNDYVEGESFNAMLRAIANNDYKDIVSPYINSQKDSDRDDLVSSAAKNIYISSLSLKKDEIPMWISYADTGKGCSIRYSEEFIDYGYRKDVVTDVACYSDADYPLYKVCYIDPNMLDTNDGMLEEINKSLGIILDLLKKLKSNLKDKEDLKHVIDEFVRSCFNEVRFLIKDSEYASEEEIRMIHYSKEAKLSAEEDKIPRFYIEREGEVIIEEVILGPKIDTFQQNEMATWLYKTGKVKEVKRSKRHYR